MATKPNMNKFSRLKLKIEGIRADILFLKKCKNNNVYPKFIKIKCAIQNSRTKRTIDKCKLYWLSCEIRYLYSKLSQLELELYSLHLKITKDLFGFEYENWLFFVVVLCESDVVRHRKKKERIHIQKFCVLIKDKVTHNNNKGLPKYVDNFVHNESTKVFSADELELLNKGLNYTPKPITPPLLDVVVDVETAIKFQQTGTKQLIRSDVKAQIVKVKSSSNYIRSPPYMDTIKSLKDKGCVYVKADKGNALVIMNSDDYENRVKDTIAEGPYKPLVKNPLPKLIRDTTATIAAVKKVFGDRVKFGLNVSNPIIPKAYALPKIHKLGKK